MKIFPNYFKVLVAIATCSFTFSAFSSDPNMNHDDQDHSHPEAVEPAEPEVLPTERDRTITVYLDTKWGSRTTKAAEMITNSHREYAKQGYQLQDVDLYTENGDLKGFFVTYELDNELKQ